VPDTPKCEFHGQVRTRLCRRSRQSPLRPLARLLETHPYQALLRLRRQSPRVHLPRASAARGWMRRVRRSAAGLPVGDAHRWALAGTPSTHRGTLSTHSAAGLPAGDAHHRALAGTPSTHRGTLSTHSAAGLPAGHAHRWALAGTPITHRGTLCTHNAAGLRGGRAHHRRTAHDSDRFSTCRRPRGCCGVARRVVGCACVVARMLQAGWCLDDPPITTSKHRPVVH
jgi:hypothetical protein